MKHGQYGQGTQCFHYKREEIVAQGFKMAGDVLKGFKESFIGGVEEEVEENEEDGVDR